MIFFPMFILTISVSLCWCCHRQIFLTVGDNTDSGDLRCLNGRKHAFEKRILRAANVLQLPEGGDFEALHCQPSRNFDRSTKLDLTTEPPLLGSGSIESKKILKNVLSLRKHIIFELWGVLYIGGAVELNLR